jgi:hypothetical protein
MSPCPTSRCNGPGARAARLPAAERERSAEQTREGSDARRAVATRFHIFRRGEIRRLHDGRCLAQSPVRVVDAKTGRFGYRPDGHWESLAGFAFGFLALGFAVTKSERAPLSADGNPEDFRYMLRSRSEAAVKGSRSEPRSGRRPLTVRPSEGYAFSPADSVFSTLSATAFR